MAVKRTRVLIADESVVDRESMVALLRSDPEIEVVGEVVRNATIVESTKRSRPDIIILGIHLSSADGFGATKEIMIEVPTPIVIVSGESDAQQVEASILALRAGALAIVARPNRSEKNDMTAQHFIATIKGMAQVKVVRHWRDQHRAMPISARTISSTPPAIIAIAASTGGPAALQRVLSDLPGDLPMPVLVVQHIADGFIDGLVTWLNAICSLKVKLAVHGESLMPHSVYIAPDGNHLGVNGRSKILLSPSEPIGGFRPSATFLFNSVAKAFGSSSMHVILTGMGQDGVTGLKEARAVGARVIAQDEASSVVFGMPGAAIGAGVVDSIVPLTSVAREILSMIRPKE